MEKEEEQHECSWHTLHAEAVEHLHPREKQLSGLSLSAWWPEGSQSVMDQHRILQRGAFAFAFSSAWNIFLLPFPFLLPFTGSSFRPPSTFQRESLPTPYTVSHILNILCISLTELLSIRNCWVYFLVHCLCLPIRIRLIQGKGLLCYSIWNSQHLEQCLAHREELHGFVE